MTKPADCVIAFALPTSEEGFRWSEQQQHSDYVRRFAAGWDQYSGVCGDLRRCISECSKVGVQIVEEVKFDEWQALFRNRVVALFAHWITDSDLSGAPESVDCEEQSQSSTHFVELWDCRADIDDMVEHIPDSFDGVLDLSVCHPSALVDKIKRRRRKCTVRYFPNELLPSVWAEMYVAVFSYLGRFHGSNGTGGNSENGADYCDLLEQVAREFRTQLGGRKR